MKRPGLQECAPPDNRRSRRGGEVVDRKAGNDQVQRLPASAAGYRNRRGSETPAEAHDPGVQRGKKVLRAAIRVRCFASAGRILASTAGQCRPLHVGKTVWLCNLPSGGNCQCADSDLLSAACVGCERNVCRLNAWIHNRDSDRQDPVDG